MLCTGLKIFFASIKRGRRQPGTINWRMGAMTSRQPGISWRTGDQKSLKISPHPVMGSIQRWTRMHIQRRTKTHPLPLPAQLARIWNRFTRYKRLIQYNQQRCRGRISAFIWWHEFLILHHVVSKKIIQIRNWYYIWWKTRKKEKKDQPSSLPSPSSPSTVNFSQYAQTFHAVVKSSHGNQNSNYQCCMINLCNCCTQYNNPYPWQEGGDCWSYQSYLDTGEGKMSSNQNSCKSQNIMLLEIDYQIWSWAAEGNRKMETEYENKQR